MGTYIVRPAARDTPSVLFELGSASRAASVLRGNLSLQAHGRSWIPHRADDIPPFAWPSRNRTSATRVLGAAHTPHGAAVPDGPGRLQRLRVRRDGSASISMRAYGFRPEAREWHDPYDDSLPETSTWRTLGVDFSARSGAEIVLVTVDGAAYFKHRRRTWQLQLGRISPDAVTIEGPRFLVQPRGSAASLQGRVLYPGTADVELQVDEDGHARIFVSPMVPTDFDALEIDARIDAHASDVTGSGPPQGFTLADPGEDEAQRAAGVDAAQPVYEVLYRETSSVKMGGGDRRPRARSSCVVVLTLQHGTPPEILPGGPGHHTLARVGGQEIVYREHLIEFSPPAPYPEQREHGATP